MFGSESGREKVVLFPVGPENCLFRVVLDDTWARIFSRWNYSCRQTVLSHKCPLCCHKIWWQTRGTFWPTVTVNASVFTSRSPHACWGFFKLWGIEHISVWLISLKLIESSQIFWIMDISLGLYTTSAYCQFRRQTLCFNISGTLLVRYSLHEIQPYRRHSTYGMRCPSFYAQFSAVSKMCKLIGLHGALNQCDLSKVRFRLAGYAVV